MKKEFYQFQKISEVKQENIPKANKESESNKHSNIDRSRKTSRADDENDTASDHSLLPTNPVGNNGISYDAEDTADVEKTRH